MNAKILFGLGSVMLAATVVMAQPPCQNYGMQKCGMKKCGASMRPGGYNKMKAAPRMHRGRFIHAVMRLNLSDEQRLKVRELMLQNMKKQVRPYDAFTNKGFDKELFIKLSKEKRDNRIQNKADMIAGVYKLLDDSQKKELKSVLSQRRMMRTPAFNPPQRESDDDNE